MINHAEDISFTNVVRGIFVLLCQCILLGTNHVWRCCLVLCILSRESVREAWGESGMDKQEQKEEVVWCEGSMIR